MFAILTYPITVNNNNFFYNVYQYVMMTSQCKNSPGSSLYIKRDKVSVRTYVSNVGRGQLSSK